MLFFFEFYVVHFHFGKKLAPALFVNDFCSPKVTTPESSDPQRLLISKVTRVATIGTLR